MSSLPPGKLHPHPAPINIYGAGVSGLLMAYYLKKNGHQVIVWEKSSRVGGKIATQQTQYGMAEKAANAIFSNDDVWELLQDLQLTPVSPRKNLKKLVFRNGKIHRQLLTFTEKLKIFFGLFKKVPQSNQFEDMSLYDFLKPLTGKKILHEVIDAGLGGVYAIKSQELTLHSIVPNVDHHASYLDTFLNLRKKNKGSKNKKSSLSFTNGMQDFIDALAKYLEGEIRLNQSPPLKLNENNVICTEAPSARLLVADHFPKLAQALNEIEYTPLSTHTVFLRHPVPALKNAFGIVCSTNELKSKGILHNTAIFPHRSKHGMWSYTFIMDIGEDYPGQIKADLAKLGGDPGSLTEVISTEWKQGIPAYNHNRMRAIKKIQHEFDEQKTTGIVLFGNYVGGISMREMISLAKNFSTNNSFHN